MTEKKARPNRRFKLLVAVLVPVAVFVFVLVLVVLMAAAGLRFAAKQLPRERVRK